MRLATFNVENLFARAKALDAKDWQVGEPVLAAFATFNQIAGKPRYDDQDKATLLGALETLGVLRRNSAGELRPSPNPFAAWALLRENRGDLLVAPKDRDPRIVAGGRGDWIGWVELLTEPVDEVAVRMTARVIDDVGADILCVVEAEDRPSLVRFNDELLDGRYGHAMLIDGNDPRGIDVGLLCTDAYDVQWVRSHVDLPDANSSSRRLFSRDCPIYWLQRREADAEPLFVLPNHLKSQSFSSGNPDPLRARQALAARAIIDGLVANGAKHFVVLGDLNKGPDKDDPTKHPTLEPLFEPGAPLVDAYGLPNFDVGSRPGTFQSCSLRNRLDYILLSPALAERVTAGGVFRKGLWGSPANVNPPAPELWTVYPEITAARHAASDHAAVWVDIDI